MQSIFLRAVQSQSFQITILLCTAKECFGEFKERTFHNIKFVNLDTEQITVRF